ncbi:MAG: IPT/TIG domain-containing protein [Thermodesulfobacteriota bacterium]
MAILRGKERLPDSAGWGMAHPARALLRHPLVWWLSALLLALALATVTQAQQPLTFQYFYDELGQLVKVIDSAGNVIEHVYDEVGNILEIKRSTAGQLAIFDFAPKRGPVGTAVTIQGQGFGATPPDNTVRFNGVSTEVTSATPTTLVAVVPPGATTGPISVTVAAATATSGQNFTVTTAPVVTSISPTAALSGATIPNFRVNGFNLTGATFSFVPSGAPPAGVAINAVAIDPSGTSATLGLTIGSDAVGQFVLVATNTNGSSEPSPSSTPTVIDPDHLDQEADTDGDGFPNGLEAMFGSDPFDPESIPDIKGPTEAFGLPFSALNTTDPSQPPPTNDAFGLSFSVQNQATP